MQHTTPPTGNGDRTRVPLWVRLTLVIAVCAVAGVGIVVVAAHLTSAAGSSANAVSAFATPTTSARVAQDENLVTAQHQQCAGLGQLVEQYLMTGNANGNPQMDQNYASYRAAILSQPSASRAGLARANADDVIQSCDNNLNEQAAQAQGKAQAQMQQQAQARAQQQSETTANAAYRATCQQHGGTVTTTMPASSGYDGENADPAGDYCSITYRGTTYQLPLTAGGGWDSSGVDENRGDCEGLIQDAQAAAQGGNPWSQQPIWHEGTGLCERGST